MSDWVKRWGYWVAAKASRPGIYRMKDGGFLLRGRITDPLSGKRRTIIKSLPDAKLDEAQRGDKDRCNHKCARHPSLRG